MAPRTVSWPTMEHKPTYYQIPKSHDTDIRRMYRWLLIFFSCVFIVGLSLILNAHRIAPYLPFSVEQQFVKPYEAMMDWNQAGDEKIEAYLQDLAEKLAESMELPEAITLSVHYLNMEESNAFATLGGHIFVTRNLLLDMPDENSISMILAHEISHIKNRDPAASMGRGILLNLILGNFLGNAQSLENLYSFGMQMGLSSYSRQQEKRSDLDALDGLYKHYGHIGGYDVFFVKMLTLKKEGIKTRGLQTHPDLDQRLEYMASVVSSQAYPVASRQPFPEQIEKKLRQASDEN